MIPARPACFAFLCFVTLQLAADPPDRSGPNRPAVYRLENEFWRVEIVPELGGKLISLKDLETGREWLWARDKQRNFNPRTPEASFGEENLLGMDELFPSLKEEVVLEYPLPGHGEIWQQAVEVAPSTLAEGELRTVLDLESMPLRYSRRIALEGPTVRFDYTVENISTREIPFLWALHPLFALQPGDRLKAELRDQDLEVKAGPGLPQLNADDRFRWPGEANGIDLERLILKEGSPAGLKFIGRSPPEGKVTLYNPTSGAELRIRYDVDALPWLAVWLSRGVWGGAHHIAIEPTNRPGESIGGTEALRPRSGRLASGSSKTWWVEFVNASGDPSSGQPSTTE